MPASLFELNGWQLEILGTLKQWEKAFQNCELIMDPDIGFITKSKGKKWSYYWLAVINIPRPRILKLPFGLHKIYRS